MLGTRVVVVLCLLLAAAGPPTVSANEPPLPDAGLDQEVQRGASVLLDATGSRDPDGDLVGYTWTVRAPNGTTVSPECPDCPHTSFTATDPGRYAVTVTVTDDDGATAADTLYVIVDDTSEPPSIRITGDTTPTVDRPTTYVAHVTPGDAPVTIIDWRLNATHVAQRTHPGRTDRYRTQFDSTAPRRVVATVTDEAGRTASATLPVDPRQALPQRTKVRTPSVDYPAPTISGPRLVTGHGPFTATYSLNAPTDAVRRVAWTATGDTSTGREHAQVDWDPGIQHVSARVTYATGEQFRATFPDGTTDVVVDPAPNVNIAGALTGGTVTGSANSTDAFGNLARLTVTSDGMTLAHATAEAPDLTARALGTQFSIDAARVDGTLTAVAVDQRGQRAEATFRLPTGQPELVSSGFVNDPVDSYHPRLDPARYTGEHVVQVDLNGVDPERVRVEVSKEDSKTAIALNRPNWARVHLDKADRLVYRTYWGSTTADDIVVNTHVQYRIKNTVISEDFNADILQVTPSPPEVIVDVREPGTNTMTGPRFEDNVKRWGIVADAGKSFDPDGSKLDFEWKYGAEPIVGNGKVAKFSSRQRGALKVRDNQNQINVWRYNFHGSYNPGISSISEISQGPYGPTETVRFRVRTPLTRATKNRYDVSIGLSVAEGPASIVGHRTVPYVQTTDGPYDQDLLGHALDEWVVEAPAHALMKTWETPVLSIYNEKRPSETRELRSLPTVTVHAAASNPQNLEVHDLRYRVERPKFSQVTVQAPASVDEYRADGYQLVETSNTGTRYHLEKRTKVQDATYRTEREAFGSAAMRRLFLSSAPEWQSAGTDTEVVTVPLTETEWRRQRDGDGEFTGETRRVKVSDARYRTLHQYEQVTRYSVPRYENQVRCTSGFCRVVPVKRTVTKTIRNRYWAHNALGWTDRPTGQTRRELVEPARYTTEYEYETTREVARTRTRYFVERDVLDSPPRYEWKHFETTLDRAYAKQLNDLSDRYRIADTSPATEWTLRRATKTVQAWTSNPTEWDTVTRTEGTIVGDKVVIEDHEYVTVARFEAEFGVDREASAAELIRTYWASKTGRSPTGYRPITKTPETTY